MSSSINPYRQQSYTQRSGASQRATRSSPAQKSGEAAAVREQQKPGQAAKTPGAPEPADGLTAQEQQAIDQRFPEKPDLAMKLYGRGQSTQTVNPNAVGSRLDVRG